MRTELRNKRSFSKNRHDFASLGKEWNEFKIKDSAMGLEITFAILYENSKKLLELEAHYEKEVLQILIKLKVKMPD